MQPSAEDESNLWLAKIAKPTENTSVYINAKKKQPIKTIFEIYNRE